MSANLPQHLHEYWHAVAQRDGRLDAIARIVRLVGSPVPASLGAIDPLRVHSITIDEVEVLVGHDASAGPAPVAITVSWRGRPVVVSTAAERRYEPGEWEETVFGTMADLVARLRRSSALEPPVPGESCPAPSRGIDQPSRSRLRTVEVRRAGEPEVPDSRG